MTETGRRGESGGARALPGLNHIAAQCNLRGHGEPLTPIPIRHGSIAGRVVGKASRSENP